MFLCTKLSVMFEVSCQQKQNNLFIAIENCISIVSMVKSSDSNVLENYDYIQQYCQWGF